MTVVLTENIWTNGLILEVLDAQYVSKQYDSKSTSVEISLSQNFNNDLRSSNITNFTNKIVDLGKPKTNKDINVSDDKRILIELVTQIQKLIQELESENSAVSEAEKVKYVYDETTPSFKRRFLSVLQTISELNIEDIFDDYYVDTGKAIVEDWIKSK